LFRYL
jgi:hypothetical protein